MPPAHTPVSSPRPTACPVLPEELLELVANLGRRLRDVERHQLPELAGCTGSLTLHEQFAQNIRGEMAGVRRDLEELKLQVDDLVKARERAAGMQHVEEVQRRLANITKLYREAVLTSKRKIDSASHLSARDELFRAAAQPGGGKGRTTTSEAPVSADDALMAATSDVTEGLRRTMQLMQQELDQSLVSNEILESSTATMQLTSNQYSTFSTLLTTSKALITSLERADVLDRLLLLFAFIFFCLCCAWIFKRRVVDKGLRVAGALGRVVARGGGSAGGARASAEAEGQLMKEELRRGVAEVVSTVKTVSVAAVTTVAALRATVTPSSTPFSTGVPVVVESAEEMPFEKVLPSAATARAQSTNSRTVDAELPSVSASVRVDPEEETEQEQETERETEVASAVVLAPLPFEEATPSPAGDLASHVVGEEAPETSPSSAPPSIPADAPVSSHHPVMHSTSLDAVHPVPPMSTTSTNEISASSVPLSSSSLSSSTIPASSSPLPIPVPAEPESHERVFKPQPLRPAPPYVDAEKRIAEGVPAESDSHERVFKPQPLRPAPPYVDAEQHIADAAVTSDTEIKPEEMGGARRSLEEEREELGEPDERDVWGSEDAEELGEDEGTSEDVDRKMLGEVGEDELVMSFGEDRPLGGEERDDRGAEGEFGADDDADEELDEIEEDEDEDGDEDEDSPEQEGLFEHVRDEL